MIHFIFASPVPSLPPEDVRCTALSPQSLQVNWQPPPTLHCNGKVQGYKVHLEPIHDENLHRMSSFIPRWFFKLFFGFSAFGPEDVEPKKTQSLTLVINKLRKYTNYTIQVLAFTIVGDGVLSRPTYCRTEEDGICFFFSKRMLFFYDFFLTAPGPPADIKVVVMSSSSLLVSWLPPLEPNGIVTKYNLYARYVFILPKLIFGICVVQ